MNQDNAINALIMLQIASFMIIFLERESLKSQLKLAPIKVKVGRCFMFLLPSLTLLSILVNPLVG
jgi:hypothetical protein